MLLLSQSMLAHARAAPTGGLDPNVVKKVGQSNTNSHPNPESKTDGQQDASKVTDLQKDSDQIK